MPSLTVKLLAEFLGTLLLVLSVFASGGNWAAIAITLGFIVYLVGPLSGACVNPAIAIASAVNGSISVLEALQFIGAEVAGGLVAVYSYRFLA